MSRLRAIQLLGSLSVVALVTIGSPGAATAAKRCPSLTIVLERSGSMLLDLAGRGGTTDPAKQRWSVARTAIERAVAAFNNRLPIGLTLFPADNLCGSGNKPRVMPEYDSLTAITTALGESDSDPDGGGMPTCGAIRQTALSLGSEPRDAYLLLVTDGLPNCDGTCRFDPQDPAGSAVAAITAAASASQPVKTIVLGIGALAQPARNALTRMAAAGGAPDRSNPTLKFFSASDVTTLDAALERIMDSLVTDDTGVTCDDSCDTTGCADAGQVCLRDRCVADPCRALACRPGEYCFSTGSAAKCVSACDKSCPAGSRCSLGVCVPEACPAACPPGSKCDSAPSSASVGTCVPDPACAGIQCTDGQACIAGTCHDDPCLFTSCPSTLSCVPFDGSCVTGSVRPESVTPGTQLAVGCAIGDPTSRRGAVSAALLFYLLGLGLLARRRRLLA